MEMSNVLVFVIMQDDAVYPTLTTRETLMFSARLRLPGSMKLEEKRKRVESLIEMLGLKECADTYVGDEKVTIQSYVLTFFNCVFGIAF